MSPQNFAAGIVKMGRGRFVALALLFIGLAVVRSSIATRLDSFTVDEAYHIAAGVTYFKFHDFRINPEHPPFVKLWVGAAMFVTGFNIDPFRHFNDKPDERNYAESAVFLQNDPDSVQRRARLAMWILNSLLLLAFTLAAERAFGGIAALGALLFLVIDPTVAAHMPVVMTDLPIALTAATGILLAVRVFRDWLWTDVLACSAFLGLALATKHSAPVALIGIVLAGSGAALLQSAAKHRVTRFSRFLKMGVMMTGALAVLWAFYGFRYSETPSGEESFNRPLTQKISDLSSPSHRFFLTFMSRTHVVPRSYTWGFADTVHAGMEGRAYPQLAFGKFYEGKAPWYFFPGAIAVKLPIGLSLLSIFGIALFIAGRLPKEWNFACIILLVTTCFFLFVLSRGATYAGVRHALPVVVLLSLSAGIALASSLSQQFQSFKVVIVLAYLAAAASALPMLRPWEYFNEFVGSSNAYRYFSDEGVDLGQRNKELAAYYHQHLSLGGNIPEILYASNMSELKARHIDFLGEDMKRDFAVVSRPERNGTIFVGPIYMIPKPYWDRAALRNTKPTARFGNLFVFSGQFYLPGNAAMTLQWYANQKLFVEKPDLEDVEKILRTTAQLDPAAYFVNVELGNVCVLRGERKLALQAYREALQNVRNDWPTKQALEKQIERLGYEDLKNLPQVRDPDLE